jgi:hypothetical protein
VYIPAATDPVRDLLYSPHTPVCTVDGKGRPIGGSLSASAHLYERFDPWLAEQLRNGYDFRRPNVSIAPCFLSNPPYTADETSWLEEELRVLQVTGCIARYDETVFAEYGPPVLVCPIRVEESGGKLRLIYDARIVNAIDKAGHVQYESLAEMLPFIPARSYCFKTDMRNGYFQIPMRKEDAPYLAFQWKGLLYYWRVLPFGLQSAPKFFERCTQPLKHHLRQHFSVPNLLFTGYLDDFFFLLSVLLHASLTLRANILTTIQMFGWVVSAPKTTEPALVTEVLGFRVDTSNQTVSVSQSRKEKFESLLRQLSSLTPADKVRARLVARFAGYLVSMDPAVWYAQRLSYPFLYALRDVAKSQEWTTSIRLTPLCFTALREIPSWWLWAQGKPFCPLTPSKFIVSDSSTRGYGGFIAQPPLNHPSEAPTDFLSLPVNDLPASTTIQRLWHDQEYLHINVKEIMAFHTLLSEMADRRAFPPGLPVGAIIDSQVAASYIKKGGGAVSSLAFIAWSITQCLLRSKCLLTYVRCVKSEQNATADALSRLEDPASAWALSQYHFNTVLSRASCVGLPYPTVDCFACPDDAVLPRFISRFYTPRAVDYDFFSSDHISHPAETVWCNPPWHLIGRVLSSLACRHLKGYLLTPHWPTKFWFPLLSNALWQTTISPGPDVFVVCSNGVVRPAPARRYKIIVSFFDFS